MKLLSIVVPCYNSQEYMEHCVDSLLATGSKNIEVIIVNDGSKDRTAEIADSYKEKYPNLVKVVHQVNGGHGEAINSGLKEATGRYFKVVDSDDWLDLKAYHKVLETLEKFGSDDSEIDLLISNFVYDKEGQKNKKVMKYHKMLPQNEIFSWEEVKQIKIGKYILMHSVIYRTQLLKDINLTLPKHTFYVDNIFVYVPLPHVKKMYYLSVNLYRYFIGRDDQSVNEQVMMRRVDQQIRVNKIMLEHYRYVLENEVCPKLKNYMYLYLEIMTAVSSILLINSGTEEDLAKKRDLWKAIKKFDTFLYYKLRNRFPGILVNIPSRLGRKISVGVYKISQKVVGFN